MPSIPTSVPNFLTLQDGVDKVIAAHPNDRAAEITALANMIGMSGNSQVKNASIMNIARYMLAPLPQMTWIDADTIEIEAKTVVMFDANNYVVKRNTAALRIELSADLDTGSEASGTWYYVYLCGDGVGSTYTACFSASASAPSGYTYYKLIGRVRNDGSSDILPFTQIEKVIYNLEEQSASAGTGNSFTEIDLTSVCSEIDVEAMFYVQSNKSAEGCMVREADETSDNNQGTVHCGSSGQRYMAGWHKIVAGSSYDRAIDVANSDNSSTTTPYIKAVRMNI